MRITEVLQRDYDGDGTIDRETLTERVFQDGKLTFEIEWPVSDPYGYNGYQSIEYTYNELDQEVFREIQHDPILGGIPDVAHVYSTYDDRGFQVGEHWQYMEWGSDNVINAENIKQFEWRDDGQPLSLQEDYVVPGVPYPLESREETWTYNANGDVTRWDILDYNFYDVPIAYTYHYRYGKLANIKLEDEIRFGDDRPRVVESFSYNSDGTLKESTEWGVHTKYGYAPWAQTQYIESNPFYETTTKFIDLDGDFQFEFEEITELWNVGKRQYGAGNPDELLVSTYDKAGNLINQDLTTWEYNEHGLTSMIVDYGNDGIYEEVLTRTVEPDYLLIA